MDTTVIAEGVNASASVDFSILALFMRADWVVRLVIVILILASFWSWAIIIDKWLAMRRVLRKADRFESTFWSGRSLEDLYRDIGSRADHPMAIVFRTAMREWRQSYESLGDFTPSMQQRIIGLMNSTAAKELSRRERNTITLATVGSVAPFIGLFGTVWGIMNAFEAIASSRDTSLAVVAPGIAEALFATALGLLAAIPAVMFYNKFSADINRYAVRLDSFTEDLSGILSRQLDEGDA